MKRAKIILAVLATLCVGAAGLFACGEQSGTASGGGQSGGVFEQVIVSESNYKLKVGETAKINAYEVGGGAVSYTSKNPSIATVDENGTVTAVAVGTAFVVVSSGADSITCKVEVYEVGYSVQLTKTQATVVVGTEFTLGAIVKRDGNPSEESVDWSFDGAGEIRQDGNTVVYRASAAGTAKITATIGKATVECTVKVMSANAAALPLPVLSENCNCSEISWEAVENAAGYQVKLNDGSWVDTLETSYSFKDDPTANGYAGGKLVDYYVSVRAVAAADDHTRYDGDVATLKIEHKHEIEFSNPNATCKTPTAKRYFCSVCDNGYEEGEYYFDHAYSDGACSVCEEAQTAGLTYLYDEIRGGYVLSGTDGNFNGKTETVYVRATYNDGEHGKLPVVAVADEALRFGEMKRVILPESVTFIGNCAMANCPNLTEVFMTGVTLLDAKTGNGLPFLACPSLTTIMIGDEFSINCATEYITVKEFFERVYCVDGADGVWTLPLKENDAGWDALSDADKALYKGVWAKLGDDVPASDGGVYYGVYDDGVSGEFSTVNEAIAAGAVKVVPKGTAGARNLYNRYKVYRGYFAGGTKSLCFLTTATELSGVQIGNAADDSITVKTFAYTDFGEIQCGTDTWSYDEKDNIVRGDEHAFENGTCARCGLAEMKEIVYSYDETAKAYTVDGFASGYSTVNLTIPETFNDGLHGEAPVAAIAEFAFSENKTLQSVVIGKNVKKIGSFAFQYCSAIETFTTLGDVTFWGNMAVRNCTSLTTVDLRYQTTMIANEFNGVFTDCTAITTIFVANGARFAWMAFNVTDSTAAELRGKANVYVLGSYDQGSVAVAEMTAANTSNALIGKVFYYDANKTADGSWYYDGNNAPATLNENKYYVTNSVGEYWDSTFVNKTNG
ncbi:MAG: leucine-rich repeat protein [Clostridia bacterium]|nr:leucine-rich repeat protein [Clostridia bacterium]